MVKTSTLAVILGVMVLSVAVFANEADGAGLVWRAVSKVGSLISDLGDVGASGCSNGQVLKYQTSNSTWICGTDSGGIASINSDTTAAQTIVGVTGNTTASTTSGATTINLGTNVVMTGGSAQTITKALTINSGTLGGQLNIAGNTFLNTGTITFPTSTDTLVGRATTDTLTNKNLADSTSGFSDDADSTKLMKFQLSGITTGTTRTVTVPNSNTILPLIVLKSASEIVSNSATQQNDDQLFFSVGANEVWLVELYTRTSMFAASDFGQSWTIPASATFIGFPDDVNNQGSATAGAGTAQIDLTTTRTKTIAANSSVLLLERGLLVTAGTSGTVQYRWAQAVAAVENTSVLQNSFIIAYRLA